jgi:PAS domain S-box-containing protein
VRTFRWLSEVAKRQAIATAGSFVGEVSFLLGSVDPDGRMRFLSPGWERALGYDAEETRDRLLAELIPLERTAADQLVQRLVDPNSRDPVELCLRAKDGTRRRYLWHRRFDPQENRTYIAGEEIEGRDEPQK